MSLSLATFDVLCQAANTVDRLREAYEPGSDAWCALTQIMTVLDGVIDWVVLSPALEDDDAD